MTGPFQLLLRVLYYIDLRYHSRAPVRKLATHGHARVHVHVLSTAQRQTSFWGPSWTVARRRARHPGMRGIVIAYTDRYHLRLYIHTTHREVLGEVVQREVQTRELCSSVALFGSAV